MSGNAGSPGGRGLVVLLHGLARTHRSMRPIEDALGDAGYETLNWDYPSRDFGLTELSNQLRDLLRGLPPEVTLHIVTHSLGGLLVRGALAEPPPHELGRVVMIAPPNQGVRLVGHIKDNPLLRSFYGPVLDELDGKTPGALGPLDISLAEIGIIAGDQSFHPVNPSSYLNFFLYPGADHDGTVEVERTKLEGMADFIVLDAHHTFMCADADVIRQVLHFLATGRFDHPGENRAG